MHASGIIILIFTLLTIALPLIFQKKIRVVFNKYYIIISLIAIFCWLYFFFGRYVQDAIELSHYNGSSTSVRYDQLQSKLLLLDMCPLMAFMLPLVSIFKKTRRFALILCPITLIGSCITIFGQVIWEDVSMDQFAQYFFVGIWPNRLYFMMHYLTLMLAVFVLICNYRYTWKDAIYTLLFYFIWLFYMNIIVVTLDIQWNASGLVANDWISDNGQYHTMYKIWPLPFPQIVVFWYSIIVIVNALLIIIKNVSTKKLEPDEINKIYNQPNVNYIELIKNKINVIKKY